MDSRDQSVTQAIYFNQVVFSLQLASCSPHWWAETLGQSWNNLILLLYNSWLGAGCCLQPFSQSSPQPFPFFIFFCPLQLWQHLNRHMGPHYALSYTLCGHWGWCKVGVKQQHSYVTVFYTSLVNDYVRTREKNSQSQYTTELLCYKSGVL